MQLLDPLAKGNPHIYIIYAWQPTLHIFFKKRKLYRSSLWMRFKSLKARQSLLGGSLLFFTEIPGRSSFYQPWKDDEGLS